MSIIHEHFLPLNVMFMLDLLPQQTSSSGKWPSVLTHICVRDQCLETRETRKQWRWHFFPRLTLDKLIYSCATLKSKDHGPYLSTMRIAENCAHGQAHTIASNLTSGLTLRTQVQVSVHSWWSTEKSLIMWKQWSLILNNQHRLPHIPYRSKTKWIFTE